MPTTNTLLRLLLVEDNKHDMLAFRRAFKTSQLLHEITHYAKAEAALEYITNNPTAFDLIICDYNLPGMSGFELCKRLLEQKVDLPMVLLTGSGAERLAVEALKAGVNDYIVKDPQQGYLNLLPVVLPEVIRHHNDRLARQQAETKLAERERYLAALVLVQQWLLATDLRENHYDEILGTLGRTAKASRVIIFENYVDEEGRLFTSQKAEWCAQGVASNFDEVILQNLPYDKYIPRWADLLKEGRAIKGHVDDFPESERKVLEALDILTILLLPIIVNGNFFGFISFVNCTEPRTWTETEIDLLRAAASGIALWQERHLAEAQLRQYTAELQARNEELDAFGHTVAHDLKNPLTVLIGVAEVLADDYYRDKHLAHYLKSIVRSGRKATNIVEELLILASVRKQDEIALRLLDMQAIVDEARERLVYVIEGAQAEIIMPTVWPTALGYAPWVEEIWTNYLSNGLKYGGQPPRLELGATPQPDGLIRFWVRDNGPGLTLTEQSQLFAPFTQLKQTRAGGHGLGLSIVRRIIEKLGGQAGVDSQVGQGSLFYFTLPQSIS